MKLQIDGIEIFELFPWQEKVIKNDILEKEFETHMKQIARWVWEQKFQRCFQRFENEWLPKLRDDPAISFIPADREAFVNLVLSRPDYKNRTQRDAHEI